MEGEARGVFEVWWDGGRPKLGEPGNEGGAFMRCLSSAQGGTPTTTINRRRPIPNSVMFQTLGWGMEGSKFVLLLSGFC